MNFFGENILIVVAHHDDVEFLFGGLLVKASKKNIHICVLCSRESNTGEAHTDVICQQKKAFNKLGIKPKNIFNHQFRSRFLPNHEDEVRLLLNDYKKKINPDSVFTHYPEDPNQDHSSLFQQVYRVFRSTNVFSGEVPNTGDTLNPNLFIKVNKEIIRKKYEALSCYNKESHKNYFQFEALESLAYMRGLHSMRYTYCEALRVIRIHIP